MARKIWPSFRLCPICAGVAGTWIWILIGIWVGWLDVESWQLTVALAMGGSVVGIAYQLEKNMRPRKILAWKILFIPIGFALAYYLIYFSAVYVISLSVIILFLIFIFIDWPVINNENVNKQDQVSEIEEKMKNCC